jgi:hypothetical protein
VVSALFTTYNIQSTTVSDREETEFQRWLARRPPA